MSLDKNQPSSFFDRNTILAVVLSFAVFFLWQSYMAKKYPQKDKENVKVEKAKQQVKPGEDQKVVAAGTATEPEKGVADEDVIVGEQNPVVRETIGLDKFSLEITSRGFGIEKITLKEYSDRENKLIQHVPVGESLLATQINGEIPVFKIQKTSNNEVVGTASINGNKINKTITIDEKNYLLEVKTVINSQDKRLIRLSTNISSPIVDVGKSFLLPSYEHQEFYSVSADGDSRDMIQVDEAFNEEVVNVSLASLNSQYFALALINKSDIYPSIKEVVKPGTQSGHVDVTYQTPQPVENMAFNYDFYFGPKDMDILAGVDEELTDLIDYGFFAFIGKPLLWTLKWLHGFLKNWGLAIIALTFLLRTVLLPINIYSFKSMRKMQKIQPRLKEIKEKFKGDPQRMNQETMLLMKQEKANPLSGCVPMLLQIPIFFAFFQVLGKSIELYKAPFFLWIQDLSVKDPFFVLPILVGAAFFLQQKITPTPTMDPAQQKVMQFVPLIFCVFMISMPSGLTLYMVVNSLFAIAQQYIFMRERTA